MPSQYRAYAQSVATQFSTTETGITGQCVRTSLAKQHRQGAHQLAFDRQCTVPVQSKRRLGPRSSDRGQA
eukprot:1510093-Amphidinium_carterae.1